MVAVVQPTEVIPLLDLLSLMEEQRVKVLGVRVMAMVVLGVVFMLLVVVGQEGQPRHLQMELQGFFMEQLFQGAVEEQELMAPAQGVREVALQEEVMQELVVLGVEITVGVEELVVYLALVAPGAFIPVPTEPGMGAVVEEVALILLIMAVATAWPAL